MNIKSMKPLDFLKGVLIAVSAIIVTAGYSAEPKHEYVVDINGDGDFRSVQECFDALPSKSEHWRRVIIREGIYKEKVTLDVYKNRVYIKGEGDVRIVWDDHTGRIDERDGHEMTTYDSWTMSLQADEVILDNITIENNAGRVGQAVALETRGDRIEIYNCRILGDQDSFFTKGYVARLMVADSYIEGTTDFIFGSSVAVFRNCELHCKSNSFITAASTPERNMYGYVFMNCRITSAENVTAVYLGRPWKSTARTVFIGCEFPKEIRPEGWHNWNDPVREGRSFYAEYGCTGVGAKRSGRVAWSHELTERQATEEYSLEKIFAKKTGVESLHDDWMPKGTDANLNR